MLLNLGDLNQLFQARSIPAISFDFFDFAALWRQCACFVKGALLMTCLNNKSVLITGGSSGLGAAAAILMAKDGAKIAIAARRRLQGEEVV